MKAAAIGILVVFLLASSAVFADDFAGATPPTSGFGSAANTAKTTTTNQTNSSIPAPPSAPVVQDTASPGTSGSSTTTKQPAQSASAPASTYSGAGVATQYGSYPAVEGTSADAGSTNTPAASETESPTAAVQKPGTLYAIIATVLGIALLVGALVIAAVKRHENAAHPPAFTVPAPPAITASSAAADLSAIHHPSVEEARQYVGRCRILGFSDGQIRDQFLHYGWSEEQAALAMRH